MTAPARPGARRVQPAVHLGPPRRPHPLSPAEPGWATTSYEPGDAIIFHCLTPHAALPNHGSALRISGDFRCQGPAGCPPAGTVEADRRGSSLEALAATARGRALNRRTGAGEIMPVTPST